MPECQMGGVAHICPFQFGDLFWLGEDLRFVSFIQSSDLDDS